nr:MAG TPA: hypothetical protein [Caudoviricetes sp.]
MRAFLSKTGVVLVISTIYNVGKRDSQSLPNQNYLLS